MRILIIALLAVFLIVIIPKTAFAHVESAMFINQSLITDQRVVALENFLNKYNSPLEPYAKEFIKAADYYEIDWRLIPSITGIESTFGKYIPYNSYNAYGWNGGDYQFKSWPDSIWHVAEVLKTKYYDRGAKKIPQIARIYAPPSVIWVGAVTHFTTEIEQASNLVPTL